jgi:flagellar assembly factor FliW
MLVNTAVFGEVEIPNEQIFTMPQGLYGFDDCKRFALVTKEEDDVTLMWFQSLDDVVPCFVVFNPYDIIDGYRPIMEAADLRALKPKKDDRLEYLVIAVVPEDISKITVNLKSPLVLNRRTGIARQVILANQEYPIKFSLVEEHSDAVNA